jgi:hypothetical protein
MERMDEGHLRVLLEEGFDGDAWHGPTLLSAVRGVGLDEALWSPGADRHSIWALTLHCAFWKHRVRERVTGERTPFPRPGDDFPELPADPTAEAWRADVALLEESHAELLEAVAANASVLAEPGPGQTRSRAKNVAGIAFHDAYHAGQVRLLRKLYELRDG